MSSRAGVGPWLRVLLRLYPGSFRDEFGAEIVAAHRQRRREASSALGRALCSAETAVDTVASACACHFDLLRQDLRFSARSLRRAPGFAATAVAVAALGIGCTTAVFSIADHVLLRPLPLADGNRLVEVWEDQRENGYARVEPSPPNFKDWRAMNRSFEEMAAFVPGAMTLSGEGEPARVTTAAVTGPLLGMVGAPVALGRVLGDRDDRDGAPAVVVLSYGLWQSRFGGRAEILGRTVRLDEVPYEVVGVLAPRFVYPSRETQLWVPLRPSADDLADRGNNYFHVVAKLRRGVTLAAAQADMTQVAASLERQYPKENAHVGAAVRSLRDALPRQSRLLLAALVGAAGCLLAIACVNLANLLLARAMARRRELAVRAAIGGGRRRLVRQLGTESAVLALLGATVGVPLGWAALPLLARLVPTALPMRELPRLDGRVLVVALLLTAVTAVAFGVVPALRALRGVDAQALREGARAGSGRRERSRAVLVTIQVASTVVLLVGTGLLLRALWRVQAVPPGFDAAHVLTVTTPLPLPRYGPTARREQFYERVLAETRVLPGVQSAGYISFLPMVARGGIWGITIAGRSRPADRRDDGTASLRYVSSGFFETMRIPLLGGRDVVATDTFAAPKVAVVSKSFADAAWPGQDPLGRRFTMAFLERTVVGVVGDVRVRGLERDSEPQVYLPYRQVADDAIIGYVPKALVVRASGDPLTLAPAIRGILRSADPDVAVADVRPLTEVVALETAPRRAQLRVLGAFAAVALLLAGIGIHGLLAFQVTSRRAELGVRMALGAGPRDIVRGVAAQGAWLALAGIGVGLILAAIAARLLTAALFGVHALDGAAFGTATGLALVTAALGSVAPAWRAVRLDPTTAMRAE